ncbi:Cysteine desulfurase [Posidoniimonas polymericola]|uniref:Cysteine desulfurase n=1 Tax=Posidoniimonas polymericola TaxID=2528002 RepID=A0A5C5YDK2_9BACT|nr:aminotransferase class V-fold PLP-dependent enzyme [Posidoniimonas polymericola]TWT73806.1 Cysteine desulfurase [Posidoniimonas polymericola]
MPRGLDMAFVRQQFPAFAEPELQGWAFFENAGGSYACQPVIDRLLRLYTEARVQPHGWHPASRVAGDLMDESTRQFAELLNVDGQELHFGPSTSQNTYVLAKAFGEMLQPGDEVVVTNQDHEANTGVWRRLADKGCVVKEWRIDRETGHLDVAQLDELLSDRTKLVIFPHCSNVVAEINPVAEISAMCHAAGALVVADGVAYAPHGLPDIRSLGVDIYLFSLYKTYGPHQGLMYIQQDLLSRLPPQCHHFNTEVPSKRMVPAGHDHAQQAAAGGIAEYYHRLFQHHFEQSAEGPSAEGPSAGQSAGQAVNELFREHERRLLAPLLDWLTDRDDLRILGPTSVDDRAPTVAIVPLKKDAREVIAVLEREKIMAGLGSFYARRVLEAMGVDLSPGVLRLSFLHYTTQDEIEQLIAALDQAL